MKLLKSAQIRSWDAFTIIHEPVSSAGLMERAALQCLAWLEKNRYVPGRFIIFCGRGNNGGDGLALARMLAGKQCQVTVFIPEGQTGSADFEINLERLQAGNVQAKYITSPDDLLPIHKDAVIIDALFGSGLNRPADGITARMIEHINLSGNKVIAIDIPSGMFADYSSTGNVMVQAAHTLTFQCYKIAFLLPENAAWFGSVHVLDIGLSASFVPATEKEWAMLDAGTIKQIYRPRTLFTHKGSFGHSLTIAGSYGKMGAAVLAAKACLHTGSGLHTCILPACGYVIMQVAVPEAMAIADAGEQYISGVTTGLQQYSAIGIGPGIGTEPVTATAVHQVITKYKKPLVIDADALNILSANKEWLALLPPASILTPHPKEFERLCGTLANDMERLQTAQQKAREWNIIIILKGHHTFIALPDGKGFFNTTGNPGMATGGSGDVLTGILTSLLAQQYTPAEAALMGVYLHGLAGDFAAAAGSQESLVASDIIAGLGNAYKQVAAYT